MDNLKKKTLTKKYTNRPSPHVSAGDFKDKRKRGNDGNWWVSIPNKNDVYSWKKYDKKGGAKLIKKKKTEKKKKTKKTGKSTKSGKSTKKK